MKKGIVITILSLLFCTNAFSQDFSFYKVSLDSLVRILRSETPLTIYFVEDTIANVRFTFNSTRNELEANSEKAIVNGGYTITKKDGKWFILKDVGISMALPPSYFAEDRTTHSNKEVLDVLSDENEIVSFQNKIYEIGRKENSKGGKVTLSGYVRNVRTGEPMIGVTVYDDASKTYTLTDEFGFYKLILPTGELALQVSGFSYEDMKLNLLLYEQGSLDIIMKEKVFSLKGATISAESMNNRRSNKMGVEIIRINRIKHIPAVFGEADVLKIILTLPGVQSVGEASGGFNVRGGASDQNLILFNDGTIYNPTHLFGMFSSFNPDVVSDVELLKSSIPASYGGRISSVLEIKGREGNAKKITGSLGLGLLTASAHIEGPISSKTRFIVGARTSYSNWLLGLLPASSSYSGGRAQFFDVNASVSHHFNSKNSLNVYGYYSRDKFRFNQDTSYRYSNINTSVKWRSNFSEKHNLTLTAGFDQYDYSTIDKSNPFNAYDYSFRIRQAFAKLNFQSTLSQNHTLSYGFNTLLYNLNPGKKNPYGEGSRVIPAALDTESAVESALYLSDTWQIAEKFSTDLGLRYSFFTAFKPFKYYGGPEFRVSGKYLVTENLTFKAGFNTMRQYIHMLSNTISMSPTDSWKLSDENIKPQSGWQAAGALYYNMFDNTVETSVEGYYKQMKNYLDYKSGAVLVMNENIAEDVVPTHGRAWGVEVMMKKPIGKLNGWISYTYSRSMLQEMQDRGVNTINRGEWYSSAHDKPHEVKMVGNYKFTHRYSLSVNLDYSTGRPVTVPVSQYYYGGGYRLYYSERNAYRIPDYFRMDMAVNIDPSHKLTKLTHFTITLGVYNITGRKNAYSVYYTTEGGNNIRAYKLCVFGAPIPYININVKF